MILRLKAKLTRQSVHFEFNSSAIVISSFWSSKKRIVPSLDLLIIASLLKFVYILFKQKLKMAGKSHDYVTEIVLIHNEPVVIIIIIIIISYSLVVSMVTRYMSRSNK